MKLFDLKPEYDYMKTEIDQAIQKVIESTAFINGPAVLELEENFSKFIGVKYSIGVASGTDALSVALMSLDIKPGDEVITTPFTFIATSEAIALLGAVPVFVDIEPDSFNIDAAQIEQKITKKTKVILPVHLYGQSADMDEILKIAKKHSLYVIEDAAQAAGAAYNKKQVGSIGDIGCFSFFPSKNLGCYGDGGMITTNNKELAVKMQAIRSHGSLKRYHHILLGYNARLDTLQAAIVNVKLKHFPEILKKRAKIADFYLKNLKKIKGNFTCPITKPNRTHTYNQFTLRTPDRDNLQKYLTENEIPTAIHYPSPLHLQPVFKYLGYKEGDFPQAERAAKEVISLPMYPFLSEDDVVRVAEAIAKFK